MGIFSENLRCPKFSQDHSQFGLGNGGSQGIGLSSGQFTLVRVCVSVCEREGRYIRGHKESLCSELGLKFLTMP